MTVSQLPGVMKVTRVQQLLIYLFIALLPVQICCADRAAGDSRPHDSRPQDVVLIMADDLGVEGLSCYGGLSYQTPHLDELIANGLRYTHAYAQPLCTNTRLQLMTGFYNDRNWIYSFYDPRPGWHKDQFTRHVSARDVRWKLYATGQLFDLSTDGLEGQPILAADDTALSAAASENIAKVLTTQSAQARVSDKTSVSAIE
jgi:hypothetical protein